MLKEKFETLCRNFSEDEELIAELWEEVETFHGEKTRHYHTLQHLEHIYKELESFELSTLVEFAIFYHDIVYDASQHNNEEISVLYAMKHLNRLGAKQVLQDELLGLILATKTHNSTVAEHTLFLDADLAILGSNNYEEYTQNVRKEYAMYDDNSYMKGREKVLKSFLEKERIYLSEHFYKLYENKARKNLEQELKSSIRFNRLISNQS